MQARNLTTNVPKILYLFTVNPLKMGNYTIFGRFEIPRRGMQARNLTTNVPKILYLKSFSEQIFSKNCRSVPLTSCKYKTMTSPPKYGVLLLTPKYGQKCKF